MARKNLTTFFTDITFFGSCSSEELNFLLIYSQGAGISALHLYKKPHTYRCSHHIRKTAAKNTNGRVFLIEDSPQEIADSTRLTL